MKTPALIRLLRPSQWLKNTFVFMPLVFSRHLFQWEYTVQAVTAFVAFCFASSCVYIINDIIDKEADKLHPTKKYRPIPAGEISTTPASITALILLGLTIFFSFKLAMLYTGMILFYIGMQILYSFILKNIVIVDVFVIAMGFMIRVLGGAVAIDVTISHWIVITTLFLSLFLAVSKRRSEIVMIQQYNIQTKRLVLEQYSIQFLDYILVITATGMAISYSLYTMAERTIAVFGTEYLIFTTIFVLFGIFRYLFLVLIKGQGENPTEILLKDIPMGLNMFFWMITVVFIIYFSK
ncbi:MAG: decaprenyl-phosphate phosphoribosyltransferase [Bacteroidota bacterium]|nr:decaprenyl-phosphate phosphoribosyltransferase [Bacteroidota bacterium]